MPEKLKNMFFQRSFIAKLGTAIKEVYPSFNKNQFENFVFDKDWEKMELKEKMRHVTHGLFETLPKDYPRALDILKQVAPPFRGFDAMVFPDFVECYGLDFFDLSLSALKIFTLCCSSEFAVRPFLHQNPQKAMEYFFVWAEDKNEFIRRLASEGCRPRLPWAMVLPKFKKDPTPIIPILEKLKTDESEHVRCSVANNLNDISKDNPDTALEICERWYGASEEINWIVKHACRDMLKSGNKRALLLFGFGDPKDIHVQNLSFDKEVVPIGENLQFSFELKVNSTKSSQVRLEYAVYYVKSRGKLSKKIFQIKESEFKPGKYTISRKQSFADQSTRTHNSGEHFLEIIVNGEEKAKKAFELV